ncbi:hypothetical protein R69927_03921 [Paraburkholderia domus]|uniref:hypothetical protein n=1 Tax=Paraburkholderia domus TaxID=2793075 RepID=UPI0019131F33|nr:hypothetical protein [Paraburkholderia domus]MBK5061093.1 hypothetical protein [Burkholderia sp. R-70199]MBK5088177.1 hypothetical protein [Burkholderia sp. R-69927]MBK5121179.1 hypothetical protein [Burkholderia sp. R-69980]MBK5179503.1 hypothetical protein [Burkholderia sp. R-69749]MCI0146442.1 hypothetical protein [Paraburkholderia sediminicola]
MKVTARLCSLFFASLTGMLDANAAGPSLAADVDITEMLSQRYNVTYYDGRTWAALPALGGNVTLKPRFSAEGGGTAPWAFYKYGIELKDKNDPKSSFYVFLATSTEPCMSHQTSSSDGFLNETLGYVYEITTQYTNLATTNVQNANVSVAYRVCSKQNVLSVRFFDPITSGIPIGIGAHVNGQTIRVSETYVILNTEGILYPQ